MTDKPDAPAPSSPSRDRGAGTRGLTRLEKAIFEMGSAGRRGYSLPPLDVPAADVSDLGPAVRTEVADFPEVSEVDVVRHFVRLSRLNYAVDMGLYPLGSCTMKYNPKIN